MHDFLLLILSLAVVVHAASLSSRYAEKIAEGFHMSRYVVGFLVVSFVSILPETLIAVNAALKGEPSLGVGTLFGSNVIDLTLVLAILVFVSGRRGLKISRAMLSKLKIYPLFLTIPLLLGLDGKFDREEGLALIIVGLIFYYYMFKKSVGISSRMHDIANRGRNTAMFVVSMVLLLIGAHFTAYSAVSLAGSLSVNPVLIGVLIVSFGTTLPELSFSMKAVRVKREDLAFGNILGSVLADATIVVGLVSLISPVIFPPTIMYVAGIFMVAASVIVLAMLHTKLKISRVEAVLLTAVWAGYIAVELIVNSLS